jgi:hypothetical protein
MVTYSGDKYPCREAMRSLSWSICRCCAGLLTCELSFLYSTYSRSIADVDLVGCNLPLPRVPLRSPPDRLAALAELPSTEGDEGELPPPEPSSSELTFSLPLSSLPRLLDAPLAPPTPIPPAPPLPPLPLPALGPMSITSRPIRSPRSSSANFLTEADGSRMRPEGPGMTSEYLRPMREIRLRMASKLGRWEGSMCQHSVMSSRNSG